MTRVDAFAPRAGVREGGTSVLVTGLFDVSGALRCWFGGVQSVSVTRLSLNHVLCVSPPAAGGLAAVVLRVDACGADALPSTQSFQYVHEAYAYAFPVWAPHST